MKVDKQKMVEDLEEEFESDIRAAADELKSAYVELLDKTERLAEIINIPMETALGKVMPRTAAQRGDVSRIGDWVEAEMSYWVQRLIRFRHEALIEQKRVDLLEKLNLSKEQKELLGIN